MRCRAGCVCGPKQRRSPRLAAVQMTQKTELHCLKSDLSDVCISKQRDKQMLPVSLTGRLVPAQRRLLSRFIVVYIIIMRPRRRPPSEASQRLNLRQTRQKNETL